ncbi:hypothetical protein GGI35DRAFT_434546 [Trichoderma velutinum]
MPQKALCWPDQIQRLASLPKGSLKSSRRASARSRRSGLRHIDHCSQRRAQPVRRSHWMLSYEFAFARDLERLREVIRRVNRKPLGCVPLLATHLNRP